MKKFAPILFLLILVVAGIESSTAHARAGYAKWLKHGDVYVVDGKFGDVQQNFRVRVAWKGNGFVVNTPLGAYRLKRRGKGVTFKVYFQEAWAHVTWNNTRAYVKYKGKRGAATVKKVASKAEPVRKQNFNTSSQ